MHVILKGRGIREGTLSTGDDTTGRPQLLLEVHQIG